MNKHRWNDQPAYKRWVKARDRALEQLHTRAQIETTDVLRRLFGNVLMAAKSSFATLKAGHVDSFDHQLRHIFQQELVPLYNILTELRARSFVLSKASEAEIIGQMLKRKHVSANVSHYQVHQAKTKRSMAGGEVHHRIVAYLDRMRRKILSMAQTSALVTDDVDKFLFDVRQAFPKARIVKQPKRILKPSLMEAGGNPKVSFSIDNIDDQAWADMLGAYMNDYVPKSRAPEYVVDTNGMNITDPTIQADGTEVWYAWEFERDLTNEFVQAVRNGQIDAAKENGITDFVWIAVIDDKTDNCCAWRDGLLVSEIEQQLGDHSDEDDECDVEGDGLNPPLHFNCRCTLAPATDDIPDKPGTMAADFDDWLMGDT